MAELVGRVRPAHPPGPTFLAYTPNGRKLVTVGVNDTIRVFDTTSDLEPTNIDDCKDANLAVVATNDFFITGSEDGSVCKFSLETNSLDQVLVRCTLPIRDLSLSPDAQWVAVASDELVVKVVNTRDMTQVKYIRDLPRPAKHVSFDYSGGMLAVSCTDGAIYVYSMRNDDVELLRKVDGLLRPLETDDALSSKVRWHPDGRAFAASTRARTVQVVSHKDWENQRVFPRPGKGMTSAGDIHTLAWSPNGGLLATATLAEGIVIWDTKTQTPAHKYPNTRDGHITDIAWHPAANTVSYTNSEGELQIHQRFVPQESLENLEESLVAAPFIHDPLHEVSGNARRPVESRSKQQKDYQPRRHATPDSLDDILNDDQSLDGFVEDDDGAGYGEVNGNGKRANGHATNGRPVKRIAAADVWQPQIHDSFQPGSTPWRGNRRYLCLNLTGFIWTVDQDTHLSVTVEFYDRDFQRDFHFTDPYGYDKACLSEKGALFSSPARGDKQPAMIYYRPHQHWTTERPDWRAALPNGETVISAALSESFVVVSTSADYIRVYTLFGTPFRIYRQKSSPAVTCTAWRDYIMTIGNGSVGGDGLTRLHYTIENVKRDETCQSEDIVALPEGAELQNVFFSDNGDPCIYDTTGVLLVLLHWRTPGQARWTPLLDTKTLERLASGRKDETYWPVAVAQDRFYCIILKGGDKYPYFPRPLLNDFEFQLPIGSARGDDADDTTSAEAKTLEEGFVRSSLLHGLQEDLVAATHATQQQRHDLARKGLEMDKILLQLLAAECVVGEERGMKALEIVGLMRDNSGRMLEAAGKVANRFGRDVLGEKIRELAERRMVGLDDEDAPVQ